MKKLDEGIYKLAQSLHDTEWQRRYWNKKRQAAYSRNLNGFAKHGAAYADMPECKKNLDIMSK